DGTFTQDSNDPTKNALTANFTADIAGGVGTNDDGKLTLSEIINSLTANNGPSLSQLVTLGLNVNAHVSVPLTLSAGASFPSLGATFVVDWGPFDPTKMAPPTPSVGLNNIHLDVGTFLNNLVQ